MTIALSEIAAALSPQFGLVVESLMKRTFNKGSDRHSLAQYNTVRVSHRSLWCTVTNRLNGITVPKQRRAVTSRERRESRT